MHFIHRYTAFCTQANIHFIHMQQANMHVHTQYSCIVHRANIHFIHCSDIECTEHMSSVAQLDSTTRSHAAAVERYSEYHDYDEPRLDRSSTAVSHDYI